MKALALAFAFALVTPLRAQFLAPELEPSAAKYKADITAFEAQKAAAMVRAQQPYVSALDGAERTATSAAALDAVAAIASERETLKTGLMRLAFPEGLPKMLQAPRKACLDAMARVDTDWAPRQKAIDTAYLQALSSVQAKAAGKPELAKQIAAEKEKVLANTDTGSPQQIEREIEALLTGKEWIHRGQYRYKFTKKGRFQEGNRQGHFEIDGKKGFVSLIWDSNGPAGEGLLFDKASRKFAHNAGGDFVPVK